MIPNLSDRGFKPEDIECSQIKDSPKRIIDNEENVPDSSKIIHEDHAKWNSKRKNESKVSLSITNEKTF